MNSLYRQFVNLLKKFPYGEKFIEHGGDFVSGSYTIWIVLVVILITGLIKGSEFKDIRSTSGLFLLLLLVAFFAYFIFRLFTKYS